MNNIQIALISTAQDVSFGELSQVSAAIQKQVSRDFAPIWNVNATVDCFDGLASVPPGYWIVTVTSDLDPADGGGIHRAEDGRPFALVRSGEGWSVSASHETLEMIIDPLEGRFVSAQSPISGQGRVDFLVEVCDPCQAATFAYPVNGKSVSDFITPNYFDPVTNSAVRYSFTGAVKRPLEVLRGCYLTWQDPVSGHSFQESFFGETPLFDDLGPTPPPLERSFRSMIYEKRAAITKSRRNADALRRHDKVAESVAKASLARASRLQREIAELLTGYHEGQESR
jgi:hypothetical protein